MTPAQAASKYHFIEYDKSTKTINMFLDHHMLSSLRTCEAYFYLDHLLHIHPRYGTGRKPWFLEYGTLLHDCFDYFYTSFLHKDQGKRDNVIDITEFLDFGKKKWFDMDMDYFATGGTERDRDCYLEIGSLDGFLSLLVQYYTFYINLRVRVIDTEITFGHGKEVHIGTFKIAVDQFKYDEDSYDMYIVNCYLTGRIDLLIDNGYKIGPVDHKHTHRFRGDEWLKFNPHDAITGYILAVNQIMAKLYPKYAEAGRQCLSSWVYHTSACSPSKNRSTGIVGPRFKATPIDKVPSQLEDYKARNLSTFKRVAELLFNDKSPEWNTNACDNMYMRTCQYKPIHEAPSEMWPDLINQHYDIGTNVWDTRNIGKKEELVNIGEMENK